ncbi:MAG: alpha/beta hydrolase [Anaerolineales bacterium]
MNHINHIVIEKNNRLLEIFDTGFSQHPAVVFAHGAGSNAMQFSAELEFLRSDFRVIAITLHGHANRFKNHTFSPEEFSLDKLAEDVILCMDSLNIDQFHFVGNSAGGLVGFELSKRFPGRLLSLCTFGTTAKLSFGKLATRFFSGIDRLMISIAPDAYLGFAAKISSGQASVQGKIKALLLDACQATPYIRSQIGDYDYLDVIRVMELPYLLMQCEFDNEINKLLTETLQAVEANPFAKTIFVEGAGHFANLDQPAQFLDLIKDHLNQVGEEYKETKNGS